MRHHWSLSIYMTCSFMHLRQHTSGRLAAQKILPVTTASILPIVRAGPIAALVDAIIPGPTARIVNGMGTQPWASLVRDMRGEFTGVLLREMGPRLAAQVGHRCLHRVASRCRAVQPSCQLYHTHKVHLDRSSPPWAPRSRLTSWNTWFRPSPCRLCTRRVRYLPALSCAMWDLSIWPSWFSARVLCPTFVWCVPICSSRGCGHACSALQGLRSSTHATRSNSPRQYHPCCDQMLGLGVFTLLGLLASIGTLFIVALTFRLGLKVLSQLASGPATAATCGTCAGNRASDRQSGGVMHVCGVPEADTMASAGACGFSGSLGPQIARTGHRDGCANVCHPPALVYACKPPLRMQTSNCRACSCCALLCE